MNNPSPSTAAGPPDIEARFRQVVAAAVGRKALDLKVLRLDEVTSLTDYFLICSGASERQVQAIADGVVSRLKSDKVRPLHVEGYETGHWVLLDYGDFVVHVFDPRTRDFYGLERLWADAPDVTGDFADA